MTQTKFSQLLKKTVFSSPKFSASRFTHLALLIGTASAIVATPVHAGAPMIKTSAPAYYRVMLGDFEITALSDGTVALEADTLLTNTSKEKTQKALAKYHLQSPVQTSVTGYLINTGNKLVLIDTGAASLFGPTLGRLRKNLRAAGYAPEQVDEIYITHMHGDHVGGLMDGDRLAFPNAIVRADKLDAEHYLNQEKMDKASADAKQGFKAAMISVGPYVKENRFKTFEGDTDLVPGIKAIASHGHTPGHSIYQIESKGKKLLLWGDLMHVAAVQFENPEVTISFDSDSKAAMTQRKKAYAEAAKQGYMVGATHLSFPGLGYIRPEGKGYAWMPVNYVNLE